MECCVGVSTETVLQVVKFYTVVKRNIKLKLTFRTVVLRRSITVRNVSFNLKFLFLYGVKFNIQHLNYYN